MIISRFSCLRLSFYFLLAMSILGCGGSSNSNTSEIGPAPEREQVEVNDIDTVYVSVSHGSDANSGGVNDPKATIQAAVNQAYLNSPPSQVFVAEGTYVSDSSTDASILIMKEGVSVYGGYSVDFSNRSFIDHETIIKDSSNDGGSDVLPNSAVVSGGSITSATILEGFTIIGGGGVYASAVTNLQNSELKIVNNRIYIAQNNPSNAFGIVNVSSSPTIENNMISGGGGYVNFGIVNIGASPVIRGNMIDTGSGYYSRGIYSYDLSFPNIYNNIVLAATGSSSYGVLSVNSRATIRNNTIYGGDGISSFGIYLSNNSTADIENNILMSKSCDDINCDSYCIYENDIGSNAQSLRNNNFTGCKTFYGNNDITESSDCLNCGASDVVDIMIIEDVNDAASISGNISFPVSGNISVDPLFESLENKDYSLQETSPNEIKASGLNGEEFGFGYDDDFDGILRTGDGLLGWSIGAFEID